MTPAVAYIRVSKERTEGVSPDTQLSKIRQYCELHDLQLVDVYRDIDISGRQAKNRPGLQEMLRRVSEGGIDRVCVYKLDRISRSVADFYRIIQTLESADCHLVSVSQNIDTSTPVGRLIRGILVEYAQFESEMLGERIRDNLGYVVEHRRKWLGGAPPIGYRLSKDGLVIHEPEAQTVRWIYHQYVQGSGTRQLARMLTERRVPTPSGATRWHYSSILNIIRSRVYLGEIQWRREWHPGNHEAIIDPDTWEAAQTRMTANTFNPGGGRKEARLLSGLLRCAVCGKRGNVKHGWRGQIRYMCSERIQLDRHACANVQVDERSLNDAVRREIMRLADPHQVVAAAHERPARSERPAEAELHDIDRRLKRIKAAMDKLFADRYDAGIITDEQFRDHNKRYLDEQAALQERRREIAHTAGAEQIDEESLRLAGRSLDTLQASWDGMQLQERRLAVGLVVREIVWGPDEATILWHWGRETPLRYDAVRRGTAYLDDRWMHRCACGFRARTAAGLASHQRRCTGA